MSTIGDMVRSVVDGALKEILRKTVGTGKRAQRRKKASTGVAGVIEDAIGELLKPTRQQKSRRKTTKSRSTTTQRKVAAKTRSHKRSLRRGAATR
jgi:hypothetical protein